MNQNSGNNNEYHDRLQKLKAIKEMGINPFKANYERTHMAEEAKSSFKEEELRDVETILEHKVQNTVKVAGRVMSFRSHGKISFANIQDASGRLQICFMQDYLGKEKYKFLKKLDVADFIGAEGEMFVTRHGEKTLLVDNFELLSKALRPLPEKWHGVKDQETKYRQRYLDTIMNEDSRERFIFRSTFVKALREFYWQEGFMEIESPYLENIASGTTAKPFMTKHNAFDIDVFLRIAGGELWHKMAVVGGFEKVFEIGKVFRNEGIDPSHLQEFTMVEHYAAYWNYKDNMDFCERMLEKVVKDLTGSTKVMIKGRDGEEVEIDFKAPYPRLEFTKIIEDDCGIDVLEHEEADTLLAEIKKKGIEIEGAEKMGYGNLVDHLYKKVSRPKLVQPCFVIRHPLSTKPLARVSDDNPKLCDTFQLLVNTWEVVNAYGELIDPLDQRERLMNQALANAGGDEEAMMMNEEYIEAMEHGMPSMTGLGFGVDRMVTLLTGENNLKDSVLFPLMKPTEEIKRKEKRLMEKLKKKSKKMKNG